MKKPEKKSTSSGTMVKTAEQIGYNQAISDYEKWIEKNREEMIDIGGIRHSVIKLPRSQNDI